MRLLFVIALWLSGRLVAEAPNDIDAKCEQILPVISDLDHRLVHELYQHKRQTGNWIREEERRGIRFKLEPKEEVTYKFLWTVKQPYHSKTLERGSLQCSIPASWRLTLEPPVSIVYPSIAHGGAQELRLHNVTTIAGVYLAKSKFSLEPDHIRILWHLHQPDLPDDAAKEIIAVHPFLNHNVTVEHKMLTKESNVQVIALHVSNHADIFDGNQRWLIMDAATQKSILEGISTTSDSAHTSWLPWYKAGLKEFESLTPQEAYKTTIVAGTDNTSVYDMASGNFVSDPVLGQDRWQLIHDTIATSVYAFSNDAAPLFAHLVIRQIEGYQLVTFAVAPDGTFESRTIISLDDPQQIGLPSAYALGF